VVTLAIFVAVFSTPEIIDAALSRVETERHILLLIAVILWTSIRWRETGSVMSFVTMSLAVLLIIFFKETTFVIMTAWACGLIVFERITRTSINATERLRIRLLSVPPLVGSLLFLVMYLLFIHPQVQASYLDGTQRPWGVRDLQQVWLVALFLALAVRWSVLRAVKPDPLWEAWVFSIFGLVCAYALLNLTHTVYTAPAAFLAWLYIGHVAQLWLSNDERFGRAALGVASLAIFLAAALQTSVSFASFSTRKELMASRARAAEFIYHFYLTSTALSTPDRLTLHFPREVWWGSGEEVAIFVKYLEARYGLSNIQVGMPAEALMVEHKEYATNGVPKGAVVTTPCVDWWQFDFSCSYGLKVSRGDLIVVFGPLDTQLLQNYRLIYTSETVGFWTNTNRTYVLLKE
jgi:hypothetical protein